MGTYLSKPVTDKESHDTHNEWLSCGSSSMQGWRESQEVKTMWFQRSLDFRDCCIPLSSADLTLLEGGEFYIFLSCNIPSLYSGIITNIMGCGAWSVGALLPSPHVIHRDVHGINSLMTSYFATDVGSVVFVWCCLSCICIDFYFCLGRT